MAKDKVEAGDGEENVVALPPEQMKRLEALTELQKKRDEQYSAYEEERKALELKYQAIYAENYKERKAIVTGETDPASSTASKGLPNFWLQAMQNHGRVAEYIEEADEDALSSLLDVSSEYLPDMGGFKLTFTFGPNDYFTDAVLTKTFHVPNLVEGKMFELDKAEGSEIHWKEGKDLTVKTVKKTVKKGKGRAKTVTKSEPVPSFFRFFETTAMDEEAIQDMEQEEAMALYEQIQSEADVGFALFNKVIPNAVNWFTGEAEDDEEDEEGDYDDEDDDEEGEDDEEEGEDDEEEDDDEAPRLVAGGRGRGGRGGKGGRRPAKAEEDKEEDEEGEEGSEETANALAAAFQKQLGGGGGDGAAGGEKQPECKQQ